MACGARTSLAGVFDCTHGRTAIAYNLFVHLHERCPIPSDYASRVLISDDAGTFRPLGPSMAIKGADPAILRRRLRGHRLEDRKRDDGGDMVPNKPQIMPRRPQHTREAAK